MSLGLNPESGNRAHFPFFKTSMMTRLTGPFFWSTTDPPSPRRKSETCSAQGPVSTWARAARRGKQRGQESLMWIDFFLEETAEGSIQRVRTPLMFPSAAPRAVFRPNAPFGLPRPCGGTASTSSHAAPRPINAFSARAKMNQALPAACFAPRRRRTAPMTQAAMPHMARDEGSGTGCAVVPVVPNVKTVSGPLPKLSIP